MQTETEMIAAAAAGDDEAFRRLVRRVYPRLRRWALARTGDFDDADEVVQRTLVRMHGALDRFEGQSKLSSWLYRILSNAAIDLSRSKGARPTARDERVMDRVDPGGDVAAGAGDASSDPVRSIHAARLAAAVRDYLSSLPPRQREVMELVDHEGLRAVDVAEMLGIEPVSVRANLFKARKAVRREILKRFPELMEGYEA